MTAEKYVKHYASGQGGFESVSVDVALRAIEYAKQEAKQQMMKDAISARVTEIYYPTDSCLEIEVTLPKDKFEDGDKVIIIKQEEE